MQNNDELKAAYARIEQGVDEFFESDKFKDYLSVMGRFHDYSVRNIMLIKQQMQHATRVAGYQTWKELGRQVKKGEKGIRIVRPVNVTVDVPTNEFDENGKRIVEKKYVPRFAPASVFDISQTEGKELPSLAQELDGDVPGYERLFSAITNISDYRMIIDDISYNADAKGMCDYTIQTIFIRPGMSQAQTLKTAVHELFHSRVHGGDGSKSRQQKEIEAEAAAYVVCSHFGLDTGDYSFPYVAAWSAGVSHEERRRSIRSIHRDASAIINEMEKALSHGRDINGVDISAAEEKIKSSAEKTLEGSDAQNINAVIYSVNPPEKKEVLMYLANENYGYRAAMKVTGLTKTEIKGLLEGGQTFEYLDAFLMQYGAECTLSEPDMDAEYDFSYNLGNMVLYDLKPEKAVSVSALVEYEGGAREDVVFAALNEQATDINGAAVDLNPVKAEELKEPYTERLEKYENLGYDSGWPMVRITYTNIEGVTYKSLNINEAADMIKKLDDRASGEPGKYMKISISYTYNDWNYEHVQDVDIVKGRMNFIDYLKLPPNIINHLKSHSSLIDMTKRAAFFAPDTTYGNEYSDRMLEWAQYCRMELNHSSDSPVIPKPPLLDDLYNLQEENDFRLER